jgi:hypothetical protein
MSTSYEKIAILAALSARVEGPHLHQLGSCTIGERIAMLARACEKFNEASTDGAVNEFAEVTRIAEATNLEAYRDAQGTLYVGRPYYFVNMGGSGEKRDRGGR